MFFAHSLVLRGVGGKTVGELMANMSSGEFTRWQAYFEVEDEMREQAKTERQAQETEERIAKEIAERSWG